MDDFVDPKPTKVTLEKKRIIERSWSLLMQIDTEVSGPVLYKHIFLAHPEALQYFPFKDQRNYLQSNIVKKQSSNVVGTIGRIVEGLDNF